jgi:hypothetical protein
MQTGRHNDALNHIVRTKDASQRTHAALVCATREADEKDAFREDCKHLNYSKRQHDDSDNAPHRPIN